MLSGATWISHAPSIDSANAERGSIKMVKTKSIFIFSTCNAANNGRLVIVNFVKQWRSHAQKAQAQGCPRSVATDVAWPCYMLRPHLPPFLWFNVINFNRAGIRLLGSQLYYAARLKQAELFLYA